MKGPCLFIDTFELSGEQDVLPLGLVTRAEKSELSRRFHLQNLSQCPMNQKNRFDILKKEQKGRLSCLPSNFVDIDFDQGLMRLLIARHIAQVHASRAKDRVKVLTRAFRDFVGWRSPGGSGVASECKG